MKNKAPIILNNLDFLLGLQFPAKKIVEKHGIYNSIHIQIEDLQAAENLIREKTQAERINIMDHHNIRSCPLDNFLFGRLNVVINDEGTVIQAFYDQF